MHIKKAITKLYSFTLTPATFLVGLPTSAGTAITHFLKCSA